MSLVSGIFILLTSCADKNSKERATFSYFTYKGEDVFYSTRIDKNNQYYNPIISGFYPDPSICRKGDDYFLVNSSFGYYPGIPIFHSKDLVNWQQIGYVLDRPSQLNLDEIRISGGIYAPAIKYNEYDDTFYLVSTCIDGIDNFIVTTKDPFCGWSDPVQIIPGAGGIDPSLFFDDDGKTYLLQNNEAPDNNPLWEGHRALWMYEFDLENLKAIGKPKVIVDGGADPSKHPVWIEGPHIYKINDYYYLIAAEGGTEENHSEVVFRSENVWGPYEPYQKNPILTQRDLSADRTNKVACIGHADIIQDKNGKWWSVFLGTRPYEGNYMFNTGRETFLLPVEWKNGFPIILLRGESVPLLVDKPDLQPKENLNISGNFEWTDNFDTDKLDMRWNFIRTPREKCYELRNNQLELIPFNRSIKEMVNPSFVGIRQKHINFEAVTEIVFSPQSNTDIAGMVCFQNEKYNFIFGITRYNDKPIVLLERNSGEETKKKIIDIPTKFIDKPIQLRIEAKGAIYNFYVAFEKDKWKTVGENENGRNLSTQVAGGFTGNYIGLYASSNH